MTFTKLSLQPDSSLPASSPKTSLATASRGGPQLPCPSSPSEALSHPSLAISRPPGRAEALQRQGPAIRSPNEHSTKTVLLVSFRGLRAPPGAGGAASWGAPHCGQLHRPDLGPRSSCASEPGINRPSPVSELPALLRALLRGRHQARPGSSFSQNQVVPKGLRSDSRRPGGDVRSPACSLRVQPVPFGPTSVPPALRMAPPPHAGIHHGPSLPARPARQPATEPALQPWGGLASVLASVLACEEVPAPARRLPAFLSETEMQGKQQRSPQRPQRPGPASQAPSPGPSSLWCPWRSLEPNKAALEQPLDFSPHGPQRLRKGKTKHLPANGTVGKDAWRKVPRLGRSCTHQKPRVCLRSKARGGFCATAAGQEISTDNRPCARHRSGPMLS